MKNNSLSLSYQIIDFWGYDLADFQVGSSDKNISDDKITFVAQQLRTKLGFGV